MNKSILLAALFSLSSLISLSNPVGQYLPAGYAPLEEYILPLLKNPQALEYYRKNQKELAGRKMMFKKMNSFGVLSFKALDAKAQEDAATCSAVFSKLIYEFSLRALPTFGQMIKKEAEEKCSKIAQVRKVPPIGTFDTIVLTPTGIKSVHGQGELFSDSEIIEKLDIIERVEIEHNIYASYTKNRRAIIQQQATRGCTAATAAMLIMDNGKKPDLKNLQCRNLGNDEDQIRDIQNAGLKPVINSANNLLELKNLIMKNGSAIVSISGKIGGHVIVVDEISKDFSMIRLRDPYHGWEITVKKDSFLKEWHGGKVIQISNLDLLVSDLEFVKGDAKIAEKRYAEAIRLIPAHMVKPSVEEFVIGYLMSQTPDALCCFVYGLLEQQNSLQ